MADDGPRAKKARLSIDSQAANDELMTEITMGTFDDPTPRPNQLTFDIDALAAALPVNTHFGPSAAAGQNPRALELAEAVKKLPQQLQRPKQTEVTSDALAAVDANLAGIDLGLVIAVIRDKGPGYLKTLSSARVEIAQLVPGERIARTVDVTLRGIATPDAAPTHVMAVIDTPAVLQRQLGLAKPTIRLLPVYHLVLAAQCASLPRFPPPVPQNCRLDANGLTVTLPVFQLTVPHTETFLWLLRFLYDGSTGHIQRALLPIPEDVAARIVTPPSVPVAFQAGVQPARPGGPSRRGFLLPPLSRAAAEVGLDELQKRVKLLHGLWSNAAALGVNDAKLWNTLDTCWDILLGAVATRLANDAGAAPKPPPRPIKKMRKSAGMRAPSSTSRVASTAVGSTAPSRVPSASTPAPVAGPSSIAHPTASASVVMDFTASFPGLDPNSLLGPPATINPAMTTLMSAVPQTTPFTIASGPAPMATAPSGELFGLPLNIQPSAPAPAAGSSSTLSPAHYTTGSPAAFSDSYNASSSPAQPVAGLPPASFSSTSLAYQYQASTSRSTLDRSSLTPSPPHLPSHVS